MADLDSRSMQASSVSMLLSFVLAPPLPTVTITQADMQHIAWTFSGMAAAGAVVGVRSKYGLIGSSIIHVAA